MNKRRKKYVWKGPQGEKSGVYLPDAETIRKEAEKIRETWNKGLRHAERMNAGQAQPVELKEIHVADIVAPQ